MISNHSNLDMVDTTRYVPLHQAHELAVRQAELCEAMRIVEECGTSPELTIVITRLGERLKHINGDLRNACLDAMGGDPLATAPRNPNEITITIDGPELARVVTANLPSVIRNATRRTAGTLSIDSVE